MLSVVRRGTGAGSRQTVIRQWELTMLKHRNGKTVDAVFRSTSRNKESRPMNAEHRFFPSLFDLSGRVAIITGSSRGIGKAIAERMAEAGARVVVSSRKAPACDAVVQAINDRFGEERAFAHPANVSDKSSLESLVGNTSSKWGRLDILVCNAATNPYDGPMANISDEQFRKVLDNNVVANHWLISMVAPRMRARRDGSIIIISSIGGMQGSQRLGDCTTFQRPPICSSHGTWP